MSDFRDRLKRLHDAHRRGKDTERGPTGVYTAEDSTDDGPPRSAGYGWERLGAVRCDDYEYPFWVAMERIDGHISHGDWTLGQCREVRHRRLAELEASLPSELEREQLLFMDTETTGLGDKAMAFMIGLGYWEEEQFVVEHLLIDDEEQEPALLQAFARRLDGGPVLVTFNGLRFDVPLLEARYHLHGLPNPFIGLPHLDVLPLSRRVFPDLNRYRLINLEREVLSFERVDDVPGKDIPPRWWRFQKTKNSELMRGVLEHNRHDVVSMEALIATAVEGGTPVGAAESKEERFQFSRRSAKGSKADDRDSAGVAEKLERTYRLRGIFGRRDRRDRRVSGEKQEEGQPTTVPAEPAAPAPTSPSVRRRVDELRSACKGLVDQNMWREAFPMLCEIIALDPHEPWAVETLATYYRRDGQDHIADHLLARLSSYD